MQTQEVIKLLDEVLSGLDKAAKRVDDTPGRANVPSTAMPEAPLADAIDREISAPGRQTSIVSLRGSEAAERFRRELETESLTITTVTSLLQLIRQALQVFGILTV